MFLALDASSKNISLAIQKNGKIIFNYNNLKPFGASDLTAVLQKAAQKCGIKPKDFKAFIVGHGPGSFTGLRVSYAMAKALAIAFNKPLVTVPSFQAMVEPFIHDFKKITVITDARKGMVYWAEFINGTMKGRERLGVLDAALTGVRDSFIVTYDANIRAAVLGKEKDLNVCVKDVYPQAAVLLAAGIAAYHEKRFVALNKFEPVYLHPKDCQVRNRLEK